HSLHHMIGGAVNIFISKYQQRVRGGIRNETHCCFENHHASALRSNQGFRNIESVFSQEIIKVIARYPAWNIWIASANQIGILVAQCFQLSVNLATAYAFAYDSGKFLLVRLSHAKSQ